MLPINSPEDEEKAVFPLFTYANQGVSIVLGQGDDQFVFVLICYWRKWQTVQSSRISSSRLISVVSISSNSKLSKSTSSSSKFCKEREMANVTQCCPKSPGSQSKARTQFPWYWWEHLPTRSLFEIWYQRHLKACPPDWGWRMSDPPFLLSG